MSIYDKRSTMSRVVAGAWLRRAIIASVQCGQQGLCLGEIFFRSDGEVVHLAVPEDNERVLARGDGFLSHRLLLADSAEIGQHVAQAVKSGGQAVFLS